MISSLGWFGKWLKFGKKHAEILAGDCENGIFFLEVIELLSTEKETNRLYFLF